MRRLRLNKINRTISGPDNLIHIITNGPGQGGIGNTFRSCLAHIGSEPEEYRRNGDMNPDEARLE